MSSTKEVDFNQYCPLCKHANEDEFDVNSACYDCLVQGWNTDSRKPLNFSETKHKEKKK